MMPYILLTIVTCFFTYLDTRKKRDSKLSFYSIVVIVAFTLLASVRSLEVGTDTKTYYKIYQILHYRGYRNIQSYELEFFYKILMVIISFFTENYGCLLFLIQFITSWFVYKAIIENVCNKYAWMGIFLFNCLMYSFNLNLMRQCISMAIILYGFKYVKQQKLLMYVYVVVFASLFHVTGLLGITIYPIYVVTIGYYEGNSAYIRDFLKKYKKINSMLIIVASIMVIYLSPTLIRGLEGFRNSFKYQSDNIRSYSFAIVPFLLMVAFIIPIVIHYHENEKKDNKMRFYIVVLAVSIVLWQLAAISREVYRISLYFWQFVMFAVPDYLDGLYLRTNKIIITAYYICLGLFFYWVYFIYGQVNNTYPYFFISM